MKRPLALLAAVILACLCVPCQAQGQSKQDAMRLFSEANAQKEKAQTHAELQQAVQKYQQALAIFERVGFKEGIALTAGNLGIIYGHWGQYDKALGQYNKVLEIFTKIGDLENVGKTLGNMGAVYYHWGQNAKAVEFYEKDLAICRKIGDSKGERAILMNLGNVQRAWGRYTQAVGYYEKALETARNIGDAQGEGDILNNWGNVYSDWGQYDKAMEYYEKSLEIRRKIGDVTGQGGTMNNMGTMYKERGEYAKAAEFYEQAVETARRIAAVKNEGDGLGSLGILHLDWGQYAKAVEFHEQQLALCRRLRDVKGEGRSLMSLGNVYRARGQHSKAVEFFGKALDIAVQIGNAKSQGLTLTNLGEAYRDRAENDKALAAFEKALEIYVKIGIPADRPKDLVGNVYLDMGELARAELFIRQANSHSSLGRLYLTKGDYGLAKTSYERLLKSSELNRNVDDLLAGYAGLGMAYEGMGDNTEAVEYYRKAVALTEDLRSSLNPTERETFFDVRVNGFYRTAPYEGLARVQIRQHKPQEALKTTEYTKARVFSEAMSRMSEGKNLAVPPEIVKQHNAITNELAAQKKKLQKAFEKNNKLVIESLEPQVKQLEGKLQAHIQMLREEYPLFAATKYPQPMALSQTELKDDEWVLSYHVTDPGIIIYLTKGKNLIKALFKPVPRKDLDELVCRFREPLEIVPGKDRVTEKLKAFDFASGKKLSELLLGDFLSELPERTPVIVVPDASLGVVPFEMLTLKEGEIKTDRKIPYVEGAEFFGDRNPVSYFQSITALTLARTFGKQARPGERMLVMADPVYQMKDDRAQKDVTTKIASGTERRHYDLMVAMEESTGGSLQFSRLPLTGELAQRLSAIFPGKVALYTGVAAGKENLLKKISPELKEYGSVVFATHGYFGKGLPGIMEPVLILTTIPHGTDGFLRMSEVMGLHMAADVVALTACQSGLGRTVSGEGTMGMGRAFQYAGAKSVLMSLWSVSEQSSVQLVESFFRHIKEGKSKLDALNLARKEIREQGYDHPFFWASFILVGETQ
jgi:tetratricopeptide (TPR) repeat protein